MKSESLTMRISSIMFHGILLLGCTLSFSLGLQNLKKRHSTEHGQNQSEPFTPPPNILEGLKDLASSKIILAKTVFMGTFETYNDEILPGKIIAMFKHKVFYKKHVGVFSDRERFIWVIDYTYGDNYHSFKYMNISSDYIIYLNGSAINVGSGLWHRSYYWVSSKPQEASQLRIKKVIEFTSSNCPSPPALKLSTSVNNHESSSLRFKCQSNSICNLPVIVFWFKEGEIIKDKEHEEDATFITFRNYSEFDINLVRSSQVTTDNFGKYSIENYPSYSVLIVKTLTGDHNGNYSCLMMNLIGLKRQDFAWPHLEIHATRVTVDKIQLHYNECNIDYCTNRGLCLINKLLEEKICLCFDTYYGIFCHYSFPTGTNEHGRNQVSDEKRAFSLNNQIFNPIFTFGLFFIFIAVICLILAFERLKKQLFTYTGSVMVKPKERVSHFSKTNQLSPNTPESSLSPLFNPSNNIEPQEDKANLD